MRGDVGAGKIEAAARAETRRFDRETQRLVEARSVDAGAHRRGDCRSAGDGDGRVMRDMAGPNDGVDQPLDWIGGKGYADGRDSHRGAIGGARPSGQVGGDAFGGQGQRFAR